MSVVGGRLLQWIHQQFRNVHAAESRNECRWSHHDSHWTDVCHMCIFGYGHVNKGANIHLSFICISSPLRAFNVKLVSLDF